MTFFGLLRKKASDDLKPLRLASSRPTSIASGRFSSSSFEVYEKCYVSLVIEVNGALATYVKWPRLVVPKA